MTVLLLLLCFSLTAFAEETPGNVNPDSFSKANPHDTSDYFSYKSGDHYECTTYQRDYSRESYGHRFEWTKTGLSKMSVCIEVDSETGGERYRNLVEEEHCPKMETVFRWYIPYEGETSRCVEMDKLTEGARFARLAPERRCAKPATTFVWSKKNEGARPECQEVDADTEGRNYRRAARDYLCEKTLNVQVAYGRKQPYVPSRAPASLAKPAPHAEEFDRRFWEDPEDLVDHVHRSSDKIHQR